MTGEFVMISKKLEIPKTLSRTESLFFDELKNFKGEDVTVVLLNGHAIRCRIIAIEFNNLHFIVEHPDGIKEMIRGESIQSVRLSTKIEKDQSSKISR
jgi:small nuclear ribonucleoprotein (snRNP)-like protein